MFFSVLLLDNHTIVLVSRGKASTFQEKLENWSWNLSEPCFPLIEENGSEISLVHFLTLMKMWIHLVRKISKFRFEALKCHHSKSKYILDLIKINTKVLHFALNQSQSNDWINPQNELLIFFLFFFYVFRCWGSIEWSRWKARKRMWQTIKS